MRPILTMLRYNREARLIAATLGITGYAAAQGQHVTAATFIENWFVLRIVFSIIRYYWPILLLGGYLLLHTLPGWLQKVSTLPPPHG